MFRRIFTAVVFTLVLCAVADATTKESMDIRVFNSEFRASDSEMLEILKKADLESHGYKKEVITKLVSEPDSDKPSYQKMYHLYKIVDCSQMNEVYQELDTLIPGIFGVDVTTRLNNEIKDKHLEAMKECKAGLEVHFKDTEGCTDQTQQRRKRRSPCMFCFGCGWARVTA